MAGRSFEEAAQVLQDRWSNDPCGTWDLSFWGLEPWGVSLVQNLFFAW